MGKRFQDTLVLRVVPVLALGLALWFVVALMLSGTILPNLSSKTIVLEPLASQINLGSSSASLEIINSITYLPVVVLLSLSLAAAIRRKHRIATALFLAGSFTLGIHGLTLYSYLAEFYNYLGQAQLSLMIGFVGACLGVGGGMFLGDRYHGLFSKRALRILPPIIFFTPPLVGILLMLAHVPTLPVSSSWAFPELIMKLLIRWGDPQDLVILLAIISISFVDGTTIRQKCADNSKLWMVSVIQAFTNIASFDLRLWFWLLEGVISVKLPSMQGGAVPAKARMEPKKAVMASVLFGVTLPLVTGLFSVIALSVSSGDGLNGFVSFLRQRFLVPLILMQIFSALFFFLFIRRWTNVGVRAKGKTLRLTYSRGDLVHIPIRESFKPVEVKIIDEITLLFRWGLLKGTQVRFESPDEANSILEKLKPITQK